MCSGINTATRYVAALLVLILCSPFAAVAATELATAAPAVTQAATTQPTQPPKYALSAGDIVKIAVYNHPDLATQTRVSENGFISFPLLGEVAVAGLSAAEAESKMAQLLKSQDFVKNPQVGIFVERHRAPMIAVLGEVHRPGKYAKEDPNSEDIKTVSDLLALAGGVTGNAADYLVITKRDAESNDVRRQVDLVALLRQGDAAQNVPVEEGDVVFVPKMDVFYIYGEVQRPGVFRLERGMSVMQALSVGGGLTLRGSQRNVRVNRRGTDGKIQTLKVDLEAQLKPDDVLFVRESIF